MPYPEVLNTHPVPGLSLYFILIFFVPLSAIVFLAFVFVTRVRRWARILTVLWVVACIPATMMMLMGAAFNWRGWLPMLQIPGWWLLGLAIIWLPMLFKELLLRIWDGPKDKADFRGKV
jgi:hypothetical protein